MSSSNSSNSSTETAPNTDKPFQLFSEDEEADGSDGEFEDAESQERDQETDNGTVSEDEPADEHANDGNISEHESNADTEEQVGNQRNENRPRNQQPNGNKRKKRQSWVWDHFRIGRNGKPRCRVGRCSKEYGAKSATATLAYHLLKKHSIHPPAKETEESNETTPTPSKKQSLFQPPLSHFGVKRRRNKHAFYKQINRKIAEMIGLDMMPYNVVHGRGFRRLLHFLVPGFVPAHRVTFSSKFVYIFR